MKKFFLASVLLMAVLCVAVLGASADGSGTATPLTLSVSSPSAMAGDTVQVTVSVTGNPGFNAIKLYAGYDTSALALVGVTDGGLFAGLFQPGEKLTTQPFPLYWAGTGNTTGTGVLVTLTFRVLETATPGSTAVSVTCAECINTDNERVAVTTEPGTVTVREAATAIRGARVSLGTDISVRYYADLLPAHKEARMRFTVSYANKTAVTDVTGSWDEVTGMYVFTCPSVTPQAMGDNIKAELILKGENGQVTVLDTREQYSVLQNCVNLLGKTAEELHISEDAYKAMQTLIADLIEYGTAAQIYRGYRTDSLINQNTAYTALLSEKNIQPSTFTAWGEEDAARLSYELTDSTKDGYSITSAGVYFDYDNCLYVRFTAPDITAENFSVTIGTMDASWNAVNVITYTLDETADHAIVGIPGGENQYIVVSDPIPASELAFSNELDDILWYEISINTLKVNKQGNLVPTAIQTLTYSVPSYVYSMQDRETPMANLAKALYNYGMSAAEYELYAENEGE